MKFAGALEFLGERSAQVARDRASLLGLSWNDGINYIFNACYAHPNLAPNIGSKNDDAYSAIQKWVDKYRNGIEQRITRRASSPPGTIADPIIDTIINARLEDLDNSQLEQIKHAHRLSMSAENILGLLLEEYLADKLIQFDWHCAWGETIRSVDFCSATGALLQIKNRSNSENSSSSRVRLGTSIEKWFRVDALTGRYMWAQLNVQFRTDIFSEDNFKQFVINALRGNPAALPVEHGNPWENQ
jgi:hypothetical protein